MFISSLGCGVVTVARVTGQFAEMQLSAVPTRPMEMNTSVFVILLNKFSEYVF